MFKRRRRWAGRGGLTAFIDEGSEIEGKYTFSGVALLNGRFKGEIVSTDTLIIGDKGVVNADIVAGRVLVSGEVLGRLRATERVELRAGARVAGDIEAPVVVMEEGAMFEGRCRMTRTDRSSSTPAAGGGSVIPLKR